MVKNNITNKKLGGASVVAKSNKYTMGCINWSDHYLQVTWMVANSTNGGGDSHTLHGPNPQTHYLIPDLHWLTTYTVLVHASNRVGRGKDSEEMNITTDATGTACVVGCV